MNNCGNCGERKGCIYFISGYGPRKCAAYWNSECETESYEKLKELMGKNKDVLDRLKNC